MRRKPRNIWWLFIGIFGLSFLGWQTNSVSPSSFLIVGIFLVSLSLTTFFLTTYLLNNVRRAGLISLCVLGIFILRYFNLRHPLYTILLVATVFSLELTRRKR